MFWKKQSPEISRPREIEVSQRGTLEIPGMRTIAARVEAVTDTHALLGLSRELDESLDPSGTTGAEIEVVGARGVIRAAGAAHPVEGEPDAVRFEFDTDASETVQRRSFFRLEVITDVLLTRENGALLKTHSLDLSAAGLLLPAVPELRLGDRVRVTIDLGEHSYVRAHAQVVRVTEDDQRGLEFELIDEAARDKLTRYLFERQRLAAHVKYR